jgi:hypothetical protein
LTIAIGTFLIRSQEPRYNGRTLEQWIKIFNRNAENREARDAIRILATKSIPILVRWLRSDPTKPLRRMPALLRRNKVIRDFVMFKMNRHHDMYALQAFALAGTNAAGTVPTLAGLVTNGTRFEAVMSVNALSLIGPGGVPSLRQALTNRDHFVRAAPAERLSFLGTNSTAAIPDLKAALSDPVTLVRTNATNALAQLAPDVLTNASPK